MAVEREDLRDWHRLFGLLLTDFFTSSPFRVDVERDLSVQQQLLDVVIVRGQGKTFPRRCFSVCHGISNTTFRHASICRITVSDSTPMTGPTFP